MNIPKDDILQFQEKILSWYAVHQRDLPWRKNRDPYRILISEVMLQQTQVSRVIPKYEQWLVLFPTIQALAASSVADVLLVWSGLGYNRRALFLKRLAEILMEDYNGEFPQDERLLLQLPGIGKYTARAILCFAFDKQLAVVDTNVKKVILTQLVESTEYVLADSHFSYKKDKKQMSEAAIWQFAETLLPEGKAYDWNQALMDYSSSVLKQEKILLPKQSKFVGSRRYYRGKLLKLLITKHVLSLLAISQLLNKETEIEWVTSLVEELRDEGFVVLEKDTVSLVR